MNILRCCAFLLFVCASPLSGSAQNTLISGIINRYAAVTAIDTCTGRLTVSDTAGFRAGEPILLIQMQGATISSANNFLFGVIQSMNYAGRYERAVIASVAPNTLYLKSRLVNIYDPAGGLQAVTIPQFPNNATVADTLRCQPWNGATGGVLAFDVANTLTLDAPVTADGAGFRGGAAYVASTNNCNFLFPETAYFYDFGNWRGAYKGEGVAKAIAGKEFGRGPQANGGGGGNDHNSGGGGGAHLSDGGNGGDNDEPGALGCDGYYPGVRGYGVFFGIGRLFLGGGGGAGHANNSPLGAGGRGGGIILISATDINGSNLRISADGLAGANANGDGAGGGGAGGSIWLKADSAPGSLVVSANGGKGGNTLNNNGDRCFGPGGGGAGGRVLSNLFGIASPPGGPAGIVTNSVNACNGSSNGASEGDAGLTEPLPDIPEGDSEYLLPQWLAGPASDTLCEGDAGLFAAQANDGNWSYQWQYNDGSGWQDLPPGGAFSGVDTDTLLLDPAAPAQNGWLLRCVLRSGACFQIASDSALLAVFATPTAAFSAAVNGYTADFSNQSSAPAFLWDFGDGNFSQATDPQHTYAAEGNYTVTLYAIAPCDTAVATQLVTVALAPTAGFFAPDTIYGCETAIVDFDNTASANSTAFNWSFPGGNPAVSNNPDPVVEYPATGVYTATQVVSNSVGADTATFTFVVQILDLPTADFSSTAFPGGVVRFDNLSQQATSYTWDFGDGTPTAGSANVDHQYAQSGTYTVTLYASNPCGVSILQQNIEVVVNGTGTGNTPGPGRLRLHPNPPHDYLYLDLGDLNALPRSLRVLDASGRTVYALDTPAGSVVQIPVQDWPAGVYILGLQFDGGWMSVKVMRE
ncbi:MAG: PKD domain-containing protein [Saprospiraceae bacterium]